MLGTVNLENDIAVKLSLNELLEIVVDEKNTERTQFRRSLSSFRSELLDQFKENLEEAFKKQFSKELKVLETLFGEPTYTINTNSYVVSVSWKENTFYPLNNLNFQQIAVALFNNFHAVTCSIDIFCLDPRDIQGYSRTQLGKSKILDDINLKEIRIKVNKELLTRKSMTNQEIYERVTELVAIPNEIITHVDELKNNLKKVYGLSVEEIIKIWKNTKKV